jgi:MFS superfamily sulfate permease-like transporter
LDVPSLSLVKPLSRRSIEQYADAKVVPGIVIVRLDAPVYFANASYFQDKLEDYEEEGLE